MSVPYWKCITDAFAAKSSRKPYLSRQKLAYYTKNNCRKSFSLHHFRKSIDNAVETGKLIQNKLSFKLVGPKKVKNKCPSNKPVYVKATGSRRAYCRSKPVRKSRSKKE